MKLFFLSNCQSVLLLPHSSSSSSSCHHAIFMILILLLMITLPLILLLMVLILILLLILIRIEYNVIPTDGSAAAGNPGRGAPALWRVQVALALKSRCFIL